MEQRHFQRVHFFNRVQVTVAAQTLETHCLDISLRGILLVLPEGVNWHLEQQIDILLELSAEQTIAMQCSVVHIDDDVVGCACDSMDLDSMTSMRRLLEFNLSPEAVNRELSELIRNH